MKSDKSILSIIFPSCGLAIGILMSITILFKPQLLELPTGMQRLLWIISFCLLMITIVVREFFYYNNIQGTFQDRRLITIVATILYRSYIQTFFFIVCTVLMVILIYQSFIAFYVSHYIIFFADFWTTSLFLFFLHRRILYPIYWFHFSLEYAAMNAFNKGNYEISIKKYNRLIAKSPDNANHYEGRGCSFYYAGQYENAIKDFTECIDLKSENEDLDSWIENCNRKIDPDYGKISN